MKTPVRQQAHAPFPSLEERERIIQRRAGLMRAMIAALVARDTDLQLSDTQIGTLVADYEATEVERMLDRIARKFQRPRDPDAQEARLYAEYVALHRRFVLAVI
jgi:hypothetical protein